MTNQCYYQVSVAVPLYRIFDYLPPASGPHLPVIGARVWVPFGNKRLVGIVVNTHSQKPDFTLKAIESTIDHEPLLDSHLLKLLSWAAEYYCHPLGEAIFTALPANLRNGKDASVATNFRWRSLAQQDTESLLKRAPKQKAVYELIAQAGTEGCSEPELARAFKDWRAALKQLQQKSLVETVTHTDKKTTIQIHQPDYELNVDQQSVLSALTKATKGFQAFLLHGVTGSGKTEIYLQYTAKLIEQGKQVLILVPEIGLTPQLVGRFQQRFETTIALLHSGLSDGERQQAWLMARTGEAKIIIGTRSAAFVPLHKPGAIIIDEEHDASLKQMDGFRYSARDLAIKRASMLGVPILLGSATPSLESLYNSQHGRYGLLTLKQRTADATLPDIVRIDLRNKRLSHGLSDTVLQAIKQELDNGGQVLVFLNRRGYAPALICNHCGWLSTCHHCDVRMTLHQRDRRLRCHVCSHEQSLPKQCPDCGHEALYPLGQGTERLEDYLNQDFADAGVIRVDRDATRRKHAMRDIIKQIRSGEKRLIIGTQMLAKGHDFPNVGTVIIVDADHGLYGLDFRAQEHMAQLVTQVAGRAGRSQRQGKVYIQTYHPDHPFFNDLLQHDYDRVSERLLKEREVTGMPPVGYLALLRVEANKMEQVESFIQQAFNNAVPLAQSHQVELLGPAVAPLERKAGRFHMQLLFKTNQRQALLSCLQAWRPGLEKIKNARQVRWSIDVDPYTLY